MQKAASSISSPRMLIKPLIDSTRATTASQLVPTYVWSEPILLRQLPGRSISGPGRQESRHNSYTCGVRSPVRHPRLLGAGDPSDAPPTPRGDGMLRHLLPAFLLVSIASATPSWAWNRRWRGTRSSPIAMTTPRWCSLPRTPPHPHRLGQPHHDHGHQHIPVTVRYDGGDPITNEWRVRGVIQTLRVSEPLVLLMKKSRHMEIRCGEYTTRVSLMGLSRALDE